MIRRAATLSSASSSSEGSLTPLKVGSLYFPRSRSSSCPFLKDLFLFFHCLRLLTKLYLILDDDIKSYFGKYGNVVDVAIMRDKQSGKSRGFAFVTFKENSHQVAQILRERLLKPSQPHTIQNRPIDVRESDGSKPPDSFLDKQGGTSSAGGSGGNNSRLGGRKEREGNGGRQGGAGAPGGGRNMSDNKRDNRGGAGGNNGGAGGHDRDKKGGQQRHFSPNRSNPEDKGGFKEKGGEGGPRSNLGKRKDHGGGGGAGHGNEYSSAPSAAKVFVGGLDYGLTEDDFRKHFEEKFGAVKAA